MNRNILKAWRRGIALLSITANWRKHLNLNNVITLALIFIITGCSEKKQEQDYTARVNNSYLTESEINSLVDTSSSSEFSRDEIINNWIKQELLYQEALSEGIVEEENFKQIIETSKKKLAGVMLLNRSYSAEKINLQDDELINYYNEHLPEFVLISDSYLLNTLKSSDHSFTVSFRSSVLNSNWDKAVATIQNDSAVISIQKNVFLSEEKIYPQKLSRIIKELYPREISIVISDEAKYHTVVQIVEKYAKGDSAPFEYVKNQIRKRLIAAAEREMIDDYIKNLYNKHQVEVKN